MEVANYCAVAGLSILFLLGYLIHLKENDIFSVKTIRKFQYLIYALMVEIVIDCVFTILEGHEVPSNLLSILKGIELTINPVLAFFVFNIFYDKKIFKKDRVIKKIRIAMTLAIIATVVLQTMSVFGQNVFFIDENNLYHRGVLMAVYIFILLFIIAILAFGIIIFSNKTQSIMKATLSSFTIVLVAGVGLRIFFPRNNYDFLCMSVSMLFLLIYYSHVTLRIDPLTKLLNRQVYSSLIEKIDYTTMIIIIDVNNFKQINDSYGHACGDRVLKCFAKIIFETYGQYTYCFRTGGDEFCAILKPNVFDKLLEETPHCDVYSMAEKFMERLDNSILKHIEDEDDGNLLKNGVSQGYGIFYSNLSEMNAEYNNLPLGKVIELADKRMYKNKELFKKEHPESNEIYEKYERIGVLYRPSTLMLIEDSECDT